MHEVGFLSWVSSQKQFCGSVYAPTRYILNVMSEPQKEPVEQSRSPYTAYVLAIGAALILSGGLLYWRITANKTEELQTASVTFIPATSRGKGQYPDGTYETIGTYAPHGVKTELHVKVTLQDDAIIDVDANLGETNPLSRQITEKFKSGYKALVIGKPIQGLKLGAVSGSSLTPLGFNEALRNIERYATNVEG